jgi:hypothetical protein
MHRYFATDPGLESLMIDGTVVRAHNAAGTVKKQGQNQADPALGRLKGGFSTKIQGG